jgi:hypothetical protein
MGGMSNGEAGVMPWRGDRSSLEPTVADRPEDGSVIEPRGKRGVLHNGINASMFRGPF